MNPTMIPSDTLADIVTSLQDGGDALEREGETARAIEIFWLAKHLERMMDSTRQLTATERAVLRGMLP